MNDNIQKKIGRNRPPRVHITYDLETEGAVIKKELPCVFGLIADLTGFRDESDVIPEYSFRKFVFVDSDNLNSVLKSFKPRAIVNINVDGKQLSYPVLFQNIEDFHPLHLVKSVPEMNEKHALRVKLTDLKTRVSNNRKLFDAAISLMTGAEKDVEKAIGWYNFISEEQKTYLFDIFSLCSGLKNENNNDNIIVVIQNNISEIDSSLNKMLNEALHTPSYQKLEGSWLGVKYLVQNLSLGESLKLRILNASFTEINQDLVRALDFDQSILFEKLYEEEYGTYGGNPYTCLLIDYLISKKAEDITFLHKISEVVSAAHIPTALGVSSKMFDLDNYLDLHKPRMISKIFDSPEFLKFKSFRSRDESRYISLILPCFMGRAPYGEKTIKVDTLDFEEEVDSHDKFCWTNSVYAYGNRIGESFAKYHWFSSIIGPQNGGIVENLPIYSYRSADGDLVIKCPTETTITDRREKEVSSQGFICLCHCKDTDYSVFFSGQSANNPPLYNTDAANNNAKISARFQYMLNCSRFAHYIKCIIRDKIGSFTTKEEIEKFLTIWIMDYVLAMDSASQDLKARYPLREASIQVQDGQTTGDYTGIVYIRPHFQMENLTISMRLVARIPKPGGA